MRIETNNATQILAVSVLESKHESEMLTYAKVKIKDDAIAKALVEETYGVWDRYSFRLMGKASEYSYLLLILRHNILKYQRSLCENTKGLKPSQNEIITAYNREMTLDTIKDDIDMKRLVIKEIKGYGACAFDGLTELEVDAMHLVTYACDTEKICTLLELTKKRYLITVFRSRQKLRRFLELDWLIML